MNNMNNNILIRKNQAQIENTDSYDCRTRKSCPLQEKCVTKDVTVYKATACCYKQHKQHKVLYIGTMTASTFNERSTQNHKSFTNN
jgi:hypothetical protein